MTQNPYPPADYFDLNQTDHAALLPADEPVWNALKRIEGYLKERLATVPAEQRILGEIMPGAVIGPEVYIGAGTVVEPGAYVKGPAWIGANCQIRHNAYVRENAIVGDGTVIGNACEIKNALIFNRAEVPHYNYVGDSLIGYRGHIGAGVILSNMKLDRGEISVPAPERAHEPAIGFGFVATTSSAPPRGEEFLRTGLRKFSAIIGDLTEVGCNSVLSPGTILGRECILYPGTMWRGVLPSGHIVKLRQEQVIVEHRR